MIYLDHAATTPPSPEAIRAFLAEAELGANPSSMHRAGFDAHTRLEEYRRTVAESVCAESEEITFTSGGTESANIALFGAARAKARRGTKILTSDAEHPCVSETLKALEGEGFTVVKIPTRGGVLDPEKLQKEADETVVLAAFMLVNNETGAIFDVSRAFSHIHKTSPHALCFCDCVQAFGKVPINVKTLGADLLSLSAHKIHALRGVGALYVRRGVRILSPVFGGGQEKGLRSGTENSPAIAAFAASAKSITENLEASCARLSSLKAHLEERLNAMDGVTTLSGYQASPHIVSASFDGYKSEVLLHLLSDAGVCVSAGSACSSKTGAKSPVLLAHGLSPEKADSTLRFSLSDTTTKEDLDAALLAVSSILQKGRFRK